MTSRSKSLFFGRTMTPGSRDSASSSDERNHDTNGSLNAFYTGSITFRYQQRLDFATASQNEDLQLSRGSIFAAPNLGVSAAAIFPVLGLCAL